MRRGLAAIAAGLVITGVSGAERLTIDLGAIDSPPWTASGATVSLAFPAPGRVRFLARLADLRVGDATAIGTMTVECADGRLAAETVHCPAATLRVQRGTGAPLVDLPVVFRGRPGDWHLEVRESDFAGGRLAISVRVREDAWTLDLGLTGASGAGIGTLAALPAGIEVGDGRADLRVAARGGGEGASLDLEAALRGFSVSDSSGLRACENLQVEISVDAVAGPSGWRGRVRVDSPAGQVYVAPVFLDLTATPLVAGGEFEWNPATSRLALAGLDLEQRGIARLRGSLVRPDSVGGGLSVDAHLTTASAGALWEAWIGPFLAGTALARVTASGRLDGRFLVRDGVPSAGTLNLDAVSVEDADGRFDLHGLDGELQWRADRSSVVPSRLSWRDAGIHRLRFGQGTLSGQWREGRFDLGAPVRVPLLDGAVRVDSLGVRGLGGDGLEWEVRGALEPVSLGPLGAALGWPPFDGTLSGSIPGVRFADGTITVDGGLTVDVFDGTVRIDALRLEHPFGVVPRLAARVEVEGLALDRLTRAFSFGTIEGRLDGRVHGLVLEGWRPVEFDAEFATPADDESRHRISQRAVDNLASLGGAGHVLSSTFLRFFREFSYRRLGLRCRLRRGVCEMGGVAPATGGYYIVEGGGVPPRIDVLGFNTRVDWSTLIERLRRVTSPQAPIIR